MQGSVRYHYPMLKRIAVEFGVWAVLTAIYRWLLWLGSGLASNALMGWGDDQIAAWFGITAPSFVYVVSFATSWGPPLLLAAATMWIYHRLHTRRRSQEVAPGNGGQPEGSTSIEKQAENIARRINGLSAKYPLMMPDHPEYQRVGRDRNEAAEAAYMREYQENIATDAQRVMAAANLQGRLDTNDRIYVNETVISRRGVEAIRRILMQIAVGFVDQPKNAASVQSPGAAPVPEVPSGKAARECLASGIRELLQSLKMMQQQFPRQWGGPPDLPRLDEYKSRLQRSREIHDRLTGPGEGPFFSTRPECKIYLWRLFPNETQRTWEAYNAALYHYVNAMESWTSQPPNLTLHDLLARQYLEAAGNLRTLIEEVTKRTIAMDEALH